MKQCHRISAALLLTCCAAAHAQWEWKDAKGGRHFSDQPPPASVPPSRILKAPRGQLPDLRRELAEPAPAAPAPPAKAVPSTAERNARFEERRAEAARQAQEAGVKTQAKAAAAVTCDNARTNLRVLESGIRIATTGKDGEPAFLDDAQKAEQIQRNRDTLAAQCK
ncbi:DUF4124 domain-containing protein [Pseudoduganella lutea]|uniref:DUF4124 domain-containing protein n=1 Tax=Pseudoduganella lutea TaxID=321985 RepID=A0A4P6L2X0_9BURK|nr:DUF4124 domain-containing protein [Pseudoduganella lutea]QBE65761.1 DUF4124 domain-containing protein [Pseudoduganella lutea]